MFRVRRRPVRKVAAQAEREANRRAREQLLRVFRPALVQTFEEFSGRVSIPRFGDSLVLGSEATMEAALGLPNLQAEVTSVLEEALEEALDAGTVLGARFSGVEGLAVNPQTITNLAAQYLQAEGALLVRGVNETTQRGIRAAISGVLQDFTTPTEGARRIASQIGLSDVQVRQLERFRDLQTRTLIPTPQADTPAARRVIERNVARQKDRLLLQRADLILDTEIQNAVQEGERMFWQGAGEDGLVDLDQLWKRWFDVRDRRVCPVCRPMHRQTVRFDEEFSSPQGWSGQRPGAHPRCRCFVEYARGPTAAAAFKEIAPGQQKDALAGLATDLPETAPILPFHVPVQPDVRVPGRPLQRGFEAGKPKQVKGNPKAWTVDHGGEPFLIVNTAPPRPKGRRRTTSLTDFTLFQRGPDGNLVRVGRFGQRKMANAYGASIVRGEAQQRIAEGAAPRPDLGFD